MEDMNYMELALNLARRGCGWTAPNPMVGAVIVKDGRVIGQGWHQKCGELHAERSALADCRETSHGAAMYVTLEPCCHHGRQPPCTDAIIESGITKVFVGSADPNPLVAGKGTAILREHGIEVIEGVLRQECDALNEVFLHYIGTGTPFVVMKYAMTMDGKIAARTGVSRWITGEEARRHVQETRHRYTGIMVGIGTVLADDPLLTCRLADCKNPVRIICDTSLQTPLSSKIVKTADKIPTIIATACEDNEKQKPFAQAGCRLLVLPTRKEHLDLKELMVHLGRDHIDSILLEGGAALNWSALESGIVQKLQCYVAPKLFGGITAKSPVGGLGVDIPDRGFRLCGTTVSQIGEDFLFESEVKYPCLQE